MTRIVTHLISALFLLALSPASALAAVDGNEVGTNVGNLLTGWATPLWAGVTGLVSLVFLINRKFTELAVFMVVAIVVGGFVFQSENVQGLVEGIWTVAAGA